MRQILLYTTLVTTLISCSPKLSSVITNKQTPFTISDFVLVLQTEDNFDSSGIEIGTIRSTDNGFSANCTYFDVIGKLKDIARQNGANILKITEHKVPDQWSTCDRITAKIYRVDNPKKFEKEIEWSKDRKLCWEDFKGTPKPFSNTNVAALTYCGFAFQTNRVTMFNKTKIFTKNNFDCKLSWVIPDQMNRPELLEHEQGHFDLCEVYTRQLRKKLIDANLTVYNLNTEANSIYKDIYNSYLERQEIYEKETNYGLDKQKQMEWTKKIADELETFNGYGGH